MPHACPPRSTVEKVARRLGVTPRTVRRWLQTGRLRGSKAGTVWQVWDGEPLPGPSSGALGTTSEGITPTALRARLRQVGARLITRGNREAGVTRRRGAVFLTWRRARSLQVTLAIGRESPTQGWAPHAVGLEYPFWLAGRTGWRPVLPLLRRYEQLRLWCAPALLRVPGVSAVVLRELTQLEAALEALQLATVRPGTTVEPDPPGGPAALGEEDPPDDPAR